MKYGEELKRLLLRRFHLHLLVGFEGLVFPNALVKPVIILAERRESQEATQFAWLSRTASLDDIACEVECLSGGQVPAHSAVTRVSKSDLSPSVPWSPFFRTPEVYDDLLSAVSLVPLRSVAQSRIGLQTFAKGFYILTKTDVAQWGIEPEYLRPLLFSPRYVRSPEILHAHQVSHVVFVCDRSESELQGTRAGSYIRRGMQTQVRVRGKDAVVEGFHLAPRLVRARRTPWYNLRTTIDRRPPFPILLPRRVFESYLVIHNRAGAVANEDFIEVRPLIGEEGVAPLLAFLNSSLGEFLMRSNAFQYGGGVFNLNPGAVRDLPVLDLNHLLATDRARLAAAWHAFVAQYGQQHARQELDVEVAECLGLPLELRGRVGEALDHLVRSTRSAGTVYRATEPQNATLW
jgi:hypothetical protein